MPKKIIIFLIVLLSALEVSATHLLGGIMTYRYIGRTGPNQVNAIYEITITVYRDCFNGQAADISEVTYPQCRRSNQ